MTDIHTFQVTPTPTPEAWVAAYGLRDLVCLDAYQTDVATELVVTADTRHQAGLDALFPDAACAPVAGGTRVTLPPTSALRLNVLGADIAIQIADDLASPLTNGKNVLFALTTEPDAAVVADWISYHRRFHGAEAALIVPRCRPGWKIDAFKQALANSPDLGTILIVEVNQPLGQPDLGAETARHYAPDAPGKGDLPPAKADPWRSALQEIAILEVCRRRFLRGARAVLRCDPSDLVRPVDKSSVFDVVQQGTGFVRFGGDRVYPFTLRPGTTARHQDHGCVAFDSKGAGNIWCVAPKRLPEESFWRQFRVAETVADMSGNQLSYWRCMAIRHPGLKVAEMVPKTSLVAAPNLIALVEKSFGVRPKSPPEAKPAPQVKNDRILIVTTMKNEGPFILEWLAWHRSIGVTDFLVYTNDCTDGTDDMFDLLQRKGIVTHLENPYRTAGGKPQHAAYLHADTTEVAQAADWVICMDVDEYINIHTGDGTLPALFAAVPDATMISMTWRLFGNADITAFRDQPIISQFTRCAPHLCRKPHHAWGFKTLFRNLGHYKKFGVHRPKGLRPEYLDAITYVNGSGQPMPDRMLRSGWRSNTSTIGYDLVTLNHYALRSAESFLVKRDRGRVNHVDRDQGLNYWFRMNHNAETDTSIQRNLPRFQAELARLMDDPEIAQQHKTCVAAHRTKIADLLQRPDYQTFFADITGDRLRALSRMLSDFGTKEFEAGPDAIPPDHHIKP